LGRELLRWDHDDFWRGGGSKDFFLMTHEVEKRDAVDAIREGIVEIVIRLINMGEEVGTKVDILKVRRR
jgi:hypothetical protein